ncbi:uncharacterized protein DS421_14g462820 [Arachis hypogaea]|nr:uncharacterized protein DS421_14g462820 [Arachis hypogaea]
MLVNRRSHFNNYYYNKLDLYLGLVEDREKCRAGGDRDSGWGGRVEQGWRRREDTSRRQGVVAVAAISTADFVTDRAVRISKLAPGTCDGE